MEQNLGFKQQLSQQQKLSYQMIQSISLLNLPSVELCEAIYNEVEKNPACFCGDAGVCTDAECYRLRARSSRHPEQSSEIGLSFHRQWHHHQKGSEKSSGI